MLSKYQEFYISMRRVDQKKKIENTHIITRILTFERFINEPLNYSSKP